MFLILTILILPTTPITFGSNGVEDTSFTFTADDFLAGVTDPDLTYDTNGVVQDNPFGDVLTISSLSSTNGTISGPDINGIYTFTPDSNFNSDLGGVVTFNYQINDGMGDLLPIVLRELLTHGMMPCCYFNTPQFITEDGGTLEGQLTATDVELSRGDNAGKSLSYYQTSSVDGLLIDADGSFTFNSSDNAYNYLALNESLTLTVNYEVTDDLLGPNLMQPFIQLLRVHSRSL